MYGALPKDLGEIDLNPTEMMFWMYCPVKVGRSSRLEYPDSLLQFQRLHNAVYFDLLDLWDKEFSLRWFDSYIYMTAKTLWVSGEYVGNRPGWHSDGFGTNDLNYIWYDRAPTEFIQGNFTLPEDCKDSMSAMEEIAKGSDVVTFPEKHLLRLDPSVIHRSPVSFEPGMRTFVKISVSTDKYDLEGNSINHNFGEIFKKKPRQVERNHPSSVNHA